MEVPPPVVREADVGLDRAQRETRILLQARDGFIDRIGVAALHVDSDRTDDEKGADGEGHHQLDEAESALAWRVVHICRFNV